jgi:hypothetical protein
MRGGSSNTRSEDSRSWARQTSAVTRSSGSSASQSTIGSLTPRNDSSLPWSNGMRSQVPTPTCPKPGRQVKAKRPAWRHHRGLVGAPGPSNHTMRGTSSADGPDGPAASTSSIVVEGDRTMDPALRNPPRRALRWAPNARSSALTPTRARPPFRAELRFGRSCVEGRNHSRAPNRIRRPQRRPSTAPE